MKRNSRLAHVRARSGMTLLEMLIATAILATLLGIVGIVVGRGTGLYQESLTGRQLEAQATRMVERIVDELMAADRSTLVFNPPSPFGATSVDYARGEGSVAGVLTTGATRRIRARLSPTEIDDGLDNDGNGLVDEYVLEIQPDVAGAPGQVITLGNFVSEYLEGELPNGADDNGNGLVDEHGLCITYDSTSSMATVRLTLQRLDAQGRLVTRTVQTSVQIRND